MRRLKLEIRRGPMEGVTTHVAAHEAPILKAMYGDGNVIPAGGIESGAYEDSTEVDPAAEFDRLVRRYGEHPSAGVPWVEYVYGHPGAGRFGEAIAAAGPSPAGLSPQAQTLADGLSKPELQSRLDAQGVDYPVRATKAELAQAVAQLDASRRDNASRRDEEMA